MHRWGHHSQLLPFPSCPWLIEFVQLKLTPEGIPIHFSHSVSADQCIGISSGYLFLPCVHFFMLNSLDVADASLNYYYYYYSIKRVQITLQPHYNTVVYSMNICYNTVKAMKLPLLHTSCVLLILPVYCLYFLCTELLLPVYCLYFDVYCLYFLCTAYTSCVLLDTSCVLLILPVYCLYKLLCTALYFLCTAYTSCVLLILPS